MLKFLTSLGCQEIRTTDWEQVAQFPYNYHGQLQIEPINHSIAENVGFAVIFQLTNITKLRGFRNYKMWFDVVLLVPCTYHKVKFIIFFY